MSPDSEGTGALLLRQVELLTEIRDLLLSSLSPTIPSVSARHKGRRENRSAREQRAIGYYALHPAADLAEISLNTGVAVRTLQTYRKLMQLMGRVQLQDIPSGHYTDEGGLEAESYDERDLE